MRGKMGFWLQFLIKFQKTKNKPKPPKITFIYLDYKNGKLDSLCPDFGTAVKI